MISGLLDPIHNFEKVILLEENIVAGGNRKRRKIGQAYGGAMMAAIKGLHHCVSGIMCDTALPGGSWLVTSG